MEAYGCSYEKLTDINLLTNLLDRLPNEMNMTKIMAPYVFEYKGLIPDDWGVSGIVIIAESHLAIHTFPDKGFLTVDIFSCNEFNVRKAISMIVSAYEPKSWDEQLIQRGREFPRSMTKAAMILENERQQRFGELAAI